MRSSALKMRKLWFGPFFLPSFLPSFLPPFFLPSFPPSFLPSFLPFFLPSLPPSFPPSSFLPSFLPSFLLLLLTRIIFFDADNNFFDANNNFFLMQIIFFFDAHAGQRPHFGEGIEKLYTFPVVMPSLSAKGKTCLDKRQHWWRGNIFFILAEKTHSAKTHANTTLAATRASKRDTEHVLWCFVCVRNLCLFCWNYLLSNSVPCS